MTKELFIFKGRSRGFLLLEVLLALSIFAFMLLAFTGLYFYGEESAAISGRRARATMLAQEGLEAVRNIRDGYCNPHDVACNNANSTGFELLTDGDHGLALSENRWIFSGISDTTDIFTRKIQVTTVDSTHKGITSTVTWRQNLQRDGEIKLETVLTNWLTFAPSNPVQPKYRCDGESCIQDDTFGTFTESDCQNTCTGSGSSGGGGGGIGDWSAPTLLSATNLSPWYAYYDKWKIQVQGNFAYVVRNFWYPHLVAMDISDPLHPVVVGQKTLSGAQINLSLLGHYVYVASSFIFKEMQVLDIADPAALPVVADFDATGILPSLGVYAQGNYTYLTKMADFFPEFLVIDTSNPTAPYQRGSYKMSASGWDVTALGDYAYVATDSDTRELQVIKVTNPSAPTRVASLNLYGSADAMSLVGSGSTIYIGRTDGSVSIVDVSTPTLPQLKSTYNAGGSVQDMVLGNAGKYLFFVTSNPAMALQVLNVEDPTHPSLVGVYNHVNKLHGLAYQESQDRVYAVGESYDSEFLVIGPRP